MKDEGLVQLGKHELDKGRSLNRIHSKFLKEGVDEGTAIRALKKIEADKKLEDYKKATTEQSNVKNAETAKGKSSFWIILLLLVFVGIILYLYFSGEITFDWASNLITKFR